MTPQDIPFRKLRHHWPIYLLALPALFMIALFQYYPAFSGIWHSFYRWNGADINEFVGLGNYARLLDDTEFWQSFRVALVFGLWNVLKMIPAILVAVCIHRVRSERTQFLYRLLFVAPMVIPPLIVVLIWRGLFFEATNGYLNRFLAATHTFDLLVWADATFHWGGIFVPGRFPAWLGDGKLLLAACIIWGFPWVGSFAVLTHLAKLQNIPRELYEAADLDGVSWWTKFTKIELPLMMGSINIMLVFVVIETIKDAGTILALAGLFGGPGGAVTVPSLLMLRKAFIDQQMGAACAVGIVLMLVVFGLQKLLGSITQWNELTSAQKLRARLAGAGVGLLLWALLGSWFLAVAAFAIALPWRRPRLPRISMAPAMAAGVEHDVPALRASGAIEIASGGVSASPAGTTEAAAATRTRPGLAAQLPRLGKHAFVWFVLLLAYMPLYLMLIVSVKNNTQFYDAPAALTFPLHWENWAIAWSAVVPALANSIFITCCSTVLTLVFALGGAYFFARVKVPGSMFLWNALLLLMMMPTIANLVPLFRLLIDLNLANTLTALIAVGAAGGQVFAIFMLRNFIADLPQALFEAAELDGASHLRQLLTIVVPLSGPILGVIGVMHAISQWNEFLLPLIVIRDHARLPVMVQLLRMAGEYIKLWGPLMAGYALASLPIIALFILCMRLFTRGLTEGAVKG
jgi:ABC-type glycerol-3-phosphate transport system permease component